MLRTPANFRGVLGGVAKRASSSWCSRLTATAAGADTDLLLSYCLIMYASMKEFFMTYGCAW